MVSLASSACRRVASLPYGKSWPSSLNVPLEQIADDASMQDVRDWDSLGQMGIAAEIHSRFGISVAAEMFCLCSVPDIMRILERHQSRIRNRHRF